MPDELAVDAQLGPGQPAVDLQGAEVIADRRERAVERRAMLLDPGVRGRGERLFQVRLGLDPAAERLLRERALGQRARRRRELIGALEQQERARVLPLLAQLHALQDEPLGLGWPPPGRPACACAGPAERHQHERARQPCAARTARKSRNQR